MAGRIKEMIDYIIQERSKNNPAIAEMTKAKFILKGINPNKFDENSSDDPLIIEKILTIAQQFNIMNLKDIASNIKSAVSTKYSDIEVVSDLKTQLQGISIKLLVYFASSRFDQDRLCHLMQESFRDCIIFGCSTAGEIVNGELLNNSVVAMAFNSNIIVDAKVEVIEHMKESLSVDGAFISFEKHFNESSYSMDEKKYVGMVLIDGISMKEEKVMDLIGNRTNVFFIGGSAGDDLKFIKTYVCANGKAYSDATVIAMLKMNDKAKFDIIKTQSFKVLETVLVANKVNVETREVIEFNNRPAIIEYANAVGAASVEDAPNYFMTHPVGLFIGETEVFIRSPQQVKGKNMVFYCNILEGMEVRLLESTNIIEDTKKAVDDKLNKLIRIDAIINFNCIERTLVLEDKNLGKQHAKIFSNMPNIGFSTYGEEYIGHLNQTSTMLVFRGE